MLHSLKLPQVSWFGAQFKKKELHPANPCSKDLQLRIILVRQKMWSCWGGSISLDMADQISFNLHRLPDIFFHDSVPKQSLGGDAIGFSTSALLKLDVEKSRFIVESPKKSHRRGWSSTGSSSVFACKRLRHSPRLEGDQVHANSLTLGLFVVAAAVRTVALSRGTKVPPPSRPAKSKLTVVFFVSGRR